MVLEHADIRVKSGSGEQFEEAVRKASSLLVAARGFVSLSLRRGVERPDRFVLLVEWETLEDHTAGFRRSPHFAEWRAMIGPFFARPPVVEHFEQVEGLGG